jgi:hypothetical protein
VLNDAFECGNCHDKTSNSIIAHHRSLRKH